MSTRPPPGGDDIPTMSESERDKQNVEIWKALSGMWKARAEAAEAKSLTIEVETREALQPFADFIKGSHMPDDFVITMGSGFARRQLTAGDCKRAATAIRTAVSLAPSSKDEGG